MKKAGSSELARHFRQVAYGCIGIWWTGLLFCTALTAWAQDQAQNKKVNWNAVETPVTQVDPLWVTTSFKVSPDGKRMAWYDHEGANWWVVVDGKAQKTYERIMNGTPIFSPNSARTAYAAWLGGKHMVIVDGKEEQSYDRISPIIFSPDSKRVAYAVQVGTKQFVVVDGKEEKPYDGVGGLLSSVQTAVG